MSPQAWREELGFTHEQMGRHVGLFPWAARYTWKNYETGVRVPSIDIMALCEELSGGRVTARSWHAVSLALSKLPPGRFYGTRLQSRTKHAARA